MVGLSRGYGIMQSEKEKEHLQENEIEIGEYGERARTPNQDGDGNC